MFGINCIFVFALKSDCVLELTILPFVLVGMAFTSIFHVKGFFVSDNGMKYVGGATHAMDGLDKDRWSFFEIQGTVKELDTTAGEFKMWWKPTTISLDSGLFKVGDDEDASKISKYATDHNAPVEIYVEYVNEANANASYPVCLDNDSVRKDKGKGVAIPTDESGSDDDYCESEHSDLDVSIEDSEEERDLGLDDGFEEELVEFAGEGTSQVRQPNDVDDSNAPHDGDGADELNEAEDDYVSEDLDSASDSGGDGCAELKPRYPKFRSEDLTKTFKFTVGMEFSSLKQFKDAILEHNVLNGKQVKFRKNDADRVRVVCKSFDTCGYTALVSRVVRSHTFRVKTLVPKHTCGRVFDNKNAKSEWVAKVIFDRMKCSKGMQINDVVTEVRTKYSTGITFSTAFKARQIARKLVDGDSVKQYALLWSYSEELKRACRGNNCKLHIERPAPTLEPRFGRFYLCLDGCKKALKIACRPQMVSKAWWSRTQILS